MKKRILSLLLAMVMIFGMLPMNAFATEATDPTEACTTEGCTYGANHEGNCSNFVVCETEGCEYAAGHEGDCSNFVACETEDCEYAAGHEGNCSNYAEPSEDEIAAQWVIDLIDSIGEVNTESAAAIAAADIAYNALTDTQKPLVTNLDVLEAAKATYTALDTPTPAEDTDEISASYTFTTGLSASSSRYSNITQVTLTGVVARKLEVSSDGRTWNVTLSECAENVNIDFKLENTKSKYLKEAYITFEGEDTSASTGIWSGSLTPGFGVNGGTVTYTFVSSYAKSTSSSRRATFTLNLTLLAEDYVNQAPRLTGDATINANIRTDEVYSLDLSTVFSDIDDNTSELTYTVSVDGADAVATEAAYSYTPAGVETKTLMFTAADPWGAVSESYTVNLTVRDNTAPALAGDASTSAGGMHGLAWTQDLSKLFTDSDGDALTYTVAINGTDAVSASASYSYTPAAAGTYTLVFQAADVKGALSPTYTVTLTAVENPAPSLTGDETQTASVDQYKTWTINLSNLFADNEGDSLSYTVSVDGADAVSASENYSYTAANSGDVSFAFQARDLAGNQSPVCTIRLTVDYVPRTTFNTSCVKSSGAYDGWLSSVTVTGAEIENYLWIGGGSGHDETSDEDHTLYIRLKSVVAEDATIDLAYALGGSTGQIKYSSSPPASVTLANGQATVKVTTTAKSIASWATTRNYTIIFTNKANNAPVASLESATATVTIGETYEVDLSTIFSDADGDALTYSLTYGGETTAVDAAFSQTISTSGENVFVFTATDPWGGTASWTATITGIQAVNTYNVTVNVPETITPSFYITADIGADGDICGDKLEATAGTGLDGIVPYEVKVPANISQISVRGLCGDADWGGMSFAAEENGTVTLRQVVLSVIDCDGQPAASTKTITYGENAAVAGTAGWLLVVGQEYTYTAVPTENTSILAQVSEKEILEAGNSIYNRTMMLNIQNPMSITVPTGARAQLYKDNKYYAATELDAKIIRDNEDGTTTYQFVADTKASGANYMYRVSMEGKITKAGWLSWGQQNLTVTYTEDDKGPDYRLNDYSGTGAANSSMTEDSVLLNINSRNHLSMSVGESRTLKAYRAWEIIKISYQNFILTPDFTYTILSGEDVVSLAEKDSLSTADGDWVTLTAVKEGVAVIEVTYDALEVTGGSYDGIYGASDPARSGIVIVQVGGSNDTSVDFGIDCFTSIGTPGSSNISYDPNNKKAWDAEFDTLYFTGSSGELQLSPSASSAITEVAVSHDKGTSWSVLTGENGSYTASIVPGNNILRIKTTSGTAYQVVRGDQITVTIQEVDGSSDGDGIVEAGETVRVSLIGLHSPIPKMAGNYNPGFGSNSDGYSGHHLNYTANGVAVYGIGAQYNFITTANYVDIVMPEDGSSVTLSNGYIGVGVIGLSTFFDGGDSHRNIPDGGCSTRGNKSTFHTRSVLPEITIEVGGEAAPNTAPIVRAAAVTEGSIYDDQKFALNPDTLFQDTDGDTLTFTVSVNGGEATAIGTDYKFIPEAAGTYTLKFTASDGEYTVEHTVTVTVTERPKEDDEDTQFDLEESEIAGYVTISFEDNGVRVEGETGLKFPVPLGTIIEPTSVPYKAGENIAQVTKRLLDHLGIGMSYSGTLESGFYLGAITNFEVDGTPYASMGEFDAGVGSGWMITQNGTFIDQGASEFVVNDGDILKWQYSCQLGADIGDDYYAAANAVIKLIDDIGEVTLDSGDAIQAARKAYNDLTEEEKQRVSNYQTLVDAESKYAELIKTVEDEAAADAVEEKIAAIGTVTLDSEDAIKAAREAYEALTDTQKALVENLAVLEAAEDALELLKLAGTDITDIYKTTGDYLAGLSAPVVGTINGEWRVIGLSRAGRSVPDSYYDAVVEYVKANIDENGRLHAVKSSDNSRLIVALTAIGKDVTDVGGYDLLSGLNEMEYIGKQGINGTIWALIAFDTHDYEIPAGDVTREKLVQAILDAQLPSGGWTLAGSVGDPDMTGMALQALAPYYQTNTSVKAAVDKALTWLSGIQNSDGTFTCSEGVTSESLAQVITGLTALGINPETDSRFIKNGVSAVDALSQFYVEGGGFGHSLTGDRNMMATEQGYYALVSYYRLLQDKTSLYDMSDVTIQTAAMDQEAADAVEALIAAIGTVTENSGDKIKAARDAYDALTDAQKALVENYEVLTAAEKAYAELIKTAEDEAAAKDVEAKIDAIGTVTLKSESKIQEARNAYDALSDVQKALVDNYDKLIAAEQKLLAQKDEEAANAVEELIAAIGTVTKNSGDKIKAARDAYDKLTEDQKKLVENYQVLTDAEAKYKELNSTAEVTFTLLGCYKHDSDVVHTLSGGNLSTWIAKKTYKVEPGATVKDVLEMALKEAGMSCVNPTGNYVESINGIGEFSNGSNSGWMYTLNGTHPGLGVAEQTVKDGDVIVFHYTDDYSKEEGGSGFGEDTAIEKVEELIDAIGTVTLNSKNKIDAARKAYDALTYAQKQEVSNYAKLTAAEAAYARLKQADDEKKAAAVEELINQIDDEITLDSEPEITAARKAYDALTADQKKLVDNYKILTDAEYDLALLKADEKDKEAAEAVEKLIDAIGTVTPDSEEKIKAARKAYDDLTDTQKALVKNYAELEAAEAKLAELQALAGVEDIYKTTGDYLVDLGTPVPGSIGGEWMVIGLIRSGREIEDLDAYYAAAVQYVQENIDENGRLHNAKSTENARMILALTAIGKDVTNVGGHNLLLGLNDMEYVQKQGINGPIWALLAMDSGNYPVPEGNVTRDALIGIILDAQLADGGWALTGTVSDPDMTGMAVQALAPYYGTNADVKKALDSAVNTMSRMQAADGSFGSIDGTSSESIAQVIAALSALGIDSHTDARFIKNGISALDALCTFYVEGGGFRHIPTGKLDGMATEQSYYALAAYFRMLEGKTALFNMTDVIDMGGDLAEEPNETLPAETEPAPTEPAADEAEGKGSFPWWLVIVIVVLAGAIVVLVIISKPKKGSYVR